MRNVVIIGGGFGGLYCARDLRSTPVRVTLVDRRNFHLFQPLLYQVATGGLSPANIASPLRSILKYQSNAATLLAEVVGFDIAGKKALTRGGETIPWDTLVIAAGMTNHYFGHNEWESLAPGLKSLEDATEIRRRILTAFEKAEQVDNAAERSRLLTFVVIGGGATGVEMAGTIAELARYTLTRDFRKFDPAMAKVILVEGHPRVLPQFHEKLSGKAAEALRTLGVEVINDSHVTEIAPDHVVVTTKSGNRRIECETVVWAAGVTSSILGKKIAEAIGAGVEVDKAGRVVVGPDCSIPGHPDIFVIGDLASKIGDDGKPLPGVAPVAMQQGRYVAEVIRCRERGKPAPGPFHYVDKGSMATIGRSRAVADLGFIRFSGWIAWLAWLFIHVLYLAQFSNRVLVVMQWFWNYVTRNRSARLITGEKALHG